MDSSEFSAYIADIITSGYLAMGLALGRETGLINYMCEQDEPLTAKEIADGLQLKERYVQEWLAGMVVSKMILMNSETKRYIIPKPHREVLQKETDFASWLATDFQRHTLVKACFRKDGPKGFTYEDFPDFFDMWHPYRSNKVEGNVDDLLSHLPSTLRSKMDEGIEMADIGTGTGEVALSLAKRFPHSQFVGIDTVESAVQTATEVAASAGIANAVYERADAEQLPVSWEKKFDWVLAYDCIHDLSNPVQVLKEIHSSLKDDGIFSMVEFNLQSDPTENIGNPLAKTLHFDNIYCCLPCSMAKEPSAGLGSTWGIQRMEGLLKSLNFKTLQKEIMKSDDNVTVHVICSKE